MHKVTYQDIQSLLENKELYEGYRLDFKRDIGNKTKEVAKDVSSFANTNGGFLIYGIDDDENNTIVGVESIVNNRNIVEWFNQAVSGNVMPDIFYKEPHCIKIPEVDKVLMIVEIPESSRKPHMLSDDHRYYIRVNDSSRAAKHHEVRDMFSYSRERKSDFEKFYKERNLDLESDNFALTKMSQRISRDYKRIDVKEGPLILFSLLPKYINEEIFKGTTAEHLQWFESNRCINIGSLNNCLYSQSYDLRSNINGYVSKHIDREKTLASYFEVLTNGYVESGFSRVFCYPYTKEGVERGFFAIDPDQIIGYVIGLLKWARNFYRECEYQEEVLFQISLKDMTNCKLYGASDKFKNIRYSHSTKYIISEEKLAITQRIAIAKLQDDDILEIAKIFGDKLSRAFGLTVDLIFENGEYPKNGMKSFGLYG